MIKYLESTIVKYECKNTKKWGIIRNFTRGFNKFCEMTLQEAIEARHSVRVYNIAVTTEIQTAIIFHCHHYQLGNLCSLALCCFLNLYHPCFAQLLL